MWLSPVPLRNYHPSTKPSANSQPSKQMTEEEFEKEMKEFAAQRKKENERKDEGPESPIMPYASLDAIVAGLKKPKSFPRWQLVKFALTQYGARALSSTSPLTAYLDSRRFKIGKKRREVIFREILDWAYLWQVTSEKPSDVPLYFLVAARLDATLNDSVPEWRKDKSEQKRECIERMRPGLKAAEREVLRYHLVSERVVDTIMQHSHKDDLGVEICKLYWQDRTAQRIYSKFCSANGQSALHAHDLKSKRKAEDIALCDFDSEWVKLQPTNLFHPMPMLVQRYINSLANVKGEYSPILLAAAGPDATNINVSDRLHIQEYGPDWATN